MEEVYECIQSGLKTLTEFLERYGKNSLLDIFQEDLFNFCVNVVRLNKDVSEEDLNLIDFFIEDFIPTDQFKSKYNNNYLKMNEQELIEFGSNSIPLSYKILADFINYCVSNPNNGYIKAYIFILNTIGYFIFIRLDQFKTLKTIQTYGKYIRNLEKYINDKFPEGNLELKKFILMYLVKSLMMFLMKIVN